MDDSKEPTTVRLFISYSWSSPTHESWVLTLASRLRQDGIDAILDKWDLQHGHDAYKFMEQMVTDPSVTKVLMICDRAYAEKADRREGGVGAESQIISPELYGKTTQNKFAAAITEVDESGKAYVPTFYKGRIYFDFSSDDQYEAQYEEVLRWALNKPLRVKPALGAVPQHIVSGTFAVATESWFQRTMSAIKQGSAFSAGFLRDFGDVIVSDFEKLRIADKNTPDFDDKIIESIQAARPYVDQMLGIATVIARYSGDSEMFECLIRILERLASYMHRPEKVTSWRSWDFDNYKYLCHEMFLSVFALLIREERFDLAQAMVEHPYFIVSDTHRERATRSYDEFRPSIESLSARNQRLKLNRISLHADMLEKAYAARVPTFTEIMQGDFVLYLRGAIPAIESSTYVLWYPITLVYATMRHRPFDVFARSESKRFFKKLAPVLGVDSVEQFKTALLTMAEKQGVMPRFDYDGLPLTALANAKHIGAVA